MIKFSRCSWRPQLVYILTMYSYAKQLVFYRAYFNPIKQNISKKTVQSLGQENKVNMYLQDISATNIYSVS